MATPAPTTKPPTKRPEDDKPKETGRGVIKAVNSGDAVVIAKIGVATGGPPPEVELALSLLTAPRLGRRGEPDEPWAWESREFLRHALIGQQVVYTVEYKAPESGRAIGTVVINGENIAKSVAQSGWARVRRPPDGKEPRGEFHAELIALSVAAEEAKIGVFQDPTNPRAVRPIITHLDAIHLYDKLKLRPLDAIVEYVRDGSTVRVELLETHHNILFKVAGVQSPVFKKGEGSAPPRPEPYAREAKYFTESNLLHRDVQVVLRGVSKSDEFCGSLTMKGRDLGEELLRNGLASFVNWNAPQERADAMRAIELASKQRKLRIWDKWEPKEQTAAQQFVGKIREIQNRGVLIVQDQAGVKHVVSMSSINVPALGAPRRGDDAAARADEPGAWEAREFLRSRLIGRKVNVELDYTKPAGTTADGRALPEKHFYTVTDGKINVALQLVERGLAKVVFHSDENRSPIYQSLVVAEKQAQSKGKGVWRAGKSEAHHINDITIRDGDKKGVDVKKAKQILSFLKDKGKLGAVVEFVLSGSKVKIHIPKEGCMVLFSVEGIRCPRQGEPFGDEALEYAREKLHQRDVEVLISSIDKAGSFIGTIYVGDRNYSVGILEAGLAEVFGPAADRSPNKTLYYDAQSSAKSKRKGIWHEWSEEKELEAAEARRAAAEARAGASNSGGHRDVLQVSVTEVIDASRFYVHVLGEGVAQLESLMAELNAESTIHAPNPAFSQSVKRNDKAICKFTDGQWYRVQVERVSDDKTEAEIRYIDYGNTEFIGVEYLLPLPPQFAQLRPQAVEASLAFLKVPTADDDYGTDAAQYFRDLVWDKTLAATVEYREGEKLFVVLEDTQNNQRVNVLLVHEGLALFDRRAYGHNPELVAALKAEQEDARRNRRNQWQYGDVPDDDLDGL